MASQEDYESDDVHCPGKNGNPAHTCKAEVMTQFGVCSLCFLTKTSKTYVRENVNHRRLKQHQIIKMNILRAKDAILQPWEAQQLEPFISEDMDGEELYNAIKSVSMSKFSRTWREKLRTVETSMNQLYKAYGFASVLIGYQRKPTGGDNYELIGPSSIIAGLEAKTDVDKNGKPTSKFDLARDVIEQKLKATYPNRVIGTLVQAEIASKLLAGLKGLNNLLKPVPQFSLSQNQIEAFDKKILKAIDEPEDNEDKTDEDIEEDENMGEEEEYEQVQNYSDPGSETNKIGMSSQDDTEENESMAEEEEDVSENGENYSDLGSETNQLGMSSQVSSEEAPIYSVPVLLGESFVLNGFANNAGPDEFSHMSQQGVTRYEFGSQNDQVLEIRTNNTLAPGKLAPEQCEPSRPGGTPTYEKNYNSNLKKAHQQQVQFTEASTTEPVSEKIENVKSIKRLKVHIPSPQTGTSTAVNVQSNVGNFNPIAELRKPKSTQNERNQIRTPGGLRDKAVKAAKVSRKLSNSTQNLISQMPGELPSEQSALKNVRGKGGFRKKAIIPVGQVLVPNEEVATVKKFCPPPVQIESIAATNSDLAFESVLKNNPSKRNTNEESRKINKVKEYKPPPVKKPTKRRQTQVNVPSKKKNAASVFINQKESLPPPNANKTVKLKVCEDGLENTILDK